MEIIAWAVIATLALITRLAGLGIRPLSDTEAAQALVSWQLYQGLTVINEHYSPLLATANLVTFALWGATEFTARFVSAVSGVLLVLMPLGLRHYLGRVGAICAGALICFSPSALHLSRTVNGEIIVTTGAALLFTGIAHLENKTGGRRTLGVAAALAGLALTVISSPLACSIIVLLLTFGGALWLAHRGAHLPCWGEIIAELHSSIKARQGILIPILIATFAAANGLFLNRGGLAMTVDQIGVWIQGFTSTAEEALLTPYLAGPVYPALWLLGLYEPLTLLAALFGAGIALGRRRPLGLLLIWWLCGGILLDALRPGRSTGEVLLTLWPAALLAGLAVGKLVQIVWKQGGWKREGITAAACLTVFAFAYITLMMYASNHGVIWQPLAAIGMFVILVVAFRQWYDSASAIRGAALAIVATLFLLHVAGTVHLNYTPVADASQPLVRVSAGEGLRDLIAALQFVSAKKANDPYLVEILASRATGPAVEWQLRAFPNVSWVNKVEQLPVEGRPVITISQFPEVVITPEGTLLTDEQYAGQDFVVRNHGQPAPMAATTFIRWYLLREPQPQQIEKAVLWVKQSSITNTSEK
ncbi:MAG: hypothetical protein ACUVSF_00070 [Anaerolineae bacterium]